jgi:hypothetical protein
VSSSTRRVSSRQRNETSSEARSATASWIASDCDEIAEYRSGAIPSSRACAVSWATMSWEFEVWIERRAPVGSVKKKNYRLCDSRS